MPSFEKGDVLMRLLDEGEVAQVLQCTRAALRRWRREKRGPSYVRLGRLIRYRQDDLAAFIEQNAVILVSTQAN